MAQRNCYSCGEPGHFASSCPEIVFSAELGTAGDGRPPWCGECDQRTRTLFDPDADLVTRCPRCNPNLDVLQQFRYCACGNAVYRWDKSECGSHQPVGKHPAPTSTGG